MQVTLFTFYKLTCINCSITPPPHSKFMYHYGNAGQNNNIKTANKSFGNVANVLLFGNNSNKPK
jgi:hypothetical protein